MSTFNIYLLLNRVTDNSDEIQLVRRIQKVSRMMLSVNIEYLGSLPYQSEIEHSARDLVPIVARYPNGILSKKMSRIIEDLLHVSKNVKCSGKSNFSVN